MARRPKAAVDRKKIEELMVKYHVDEREVYMAILVSWGVPGGDAFGALMGCKPQFREEMWERYRADKENVGTLSLIQELASGSTQSSQPATITHDLKSKDGMIDALAEQAGEATDPKQKADILMKIADLQRMKQDENTEKEKLTHYYLPLRCEVCPWKNDARSVEGNT